MSATSVVRIAVAATLALVTTPPLAADRRIAVLTPAAPWSPKCEGGAWRDDKTLLERCSVLDTLADEARAGAVAALRGRPWTVMTRENTALLLKEMGSGACTEGECEVETAKLIGADQVVSGTVTFIEGTWFVTLKLHEVATAKLLDAAKLKAATQVDLIEKVQAGTEELLRRGLGLGGVAPTGTPIASAPASPPAVVAACPPGQEDVGGRCCWPGQDWGESAGRCIGSASCPAGFVANGEGCVPGCSAGKVVVAGRCCWPGQDWGTRAGRCVGKPECPAGLAANANGECEDPAPGMARLPGGTFTMGSRGFFSKDVVTVAPFFLDLTEVTVAAYERCVKAGGCTVPATREHCNWGRRDRVAHPINCLDWFQATAYCSWAGKRLPSEEEWEWAARGAERGSTFPWGSTRPAEQLCWSGGKVRRKDLGTCEVGSFPSGDSPHGIKDLAGNVFEWTSTVYSGKERIDRGGAWDKDDEEYFTASGRDRYSERSQPEDAGVRCAKRAE